MAKVLRHEHLIIRANVNKPPTTSEEIIDWIRVLIDKIGMKLLNGPHASYVDVPGNRGATGVAIIETSHIAIHVWDEPVPALIQLDVYSCDKLDPKVVREHLEKFDPVKVQFKFLDREHYLKEVDIKL